MVSFHFLCRLLSYTTSTFLLLHLLSLFFVARIFHPIIFLFFSFSSYFIPFSLILRTFRSPVLFTLSALLLLPFHHFVILYCSSFISPISSFSFLLPIFSISSYSYPILWSSILSLIRHPLNTEILAPESDATHNTT
jgi:hypothetical protein